MVTGSTEQNQPSTATNSAAAERARAAADEIDALLVPFKDYGKFPDIPTLTAIICKHFPPLRQQYR
jgi:hypothetical protein